MGGAVINAGDFLIEERTKALLRYFIPDAEITTLQRVRKDYDDSINYLNSFDAILFAGGPIYQPNIYPSSIPFVSKIHWSKIIPPVFFIGGGLKTDVYQSVLSPSTKEFFALGLKQGIPLGCRDIQTYRFLKHQGFSKVMITGCPAWYNIDYLNKKDISFKSPNSFMKICVSEPALDTNVRLLKSLIVHLRKRFPQAEIILINHREEKPSILTMVNNLGESFGIKYRNIAGLADGFAIYNDCDLHVGFRVHAHIYNLSIRNFSILFNEDVRGNGVNQTLGLENLNIEEPPFIKKSVFGKYFLGRYNATISNDSIICSQFDDYLEYTEMMNYQNYIEAFRRMEYYFNYMSQHFSMIADEIYNKKTENKS
jgi:hypothetical protein